MFALTGTRMRPVFPSIPDPPALTHLLMRTLSLGVLAAFLSLSGFAPLAPEGRDLNLTIYNESGYTITALNSSYCHNAGRETRSRQLTQPLYPGENIDIAVLPGCVNFRAIADSGHHFYYNLVVTEVDVYEWVIVSE